MALKLKALRALTDEQLVEYYDRQAESVNPSLEFYRQELYRREQDRQTQSMLRYTLWITFMTFVMSIATIVNVWLAYKLLK